MHYCKTKKKHSDFICVVKVLVTQKTIAGSGVTSENSNDG